MKHQNNTDEKLESIARDLRGIRRLLMALIVGIVIIIGIMIDPQLTILLTIGGGALYLFLLVCEAALNRARRRRHEAARFRELSGRQFTDSKQ